MVRLLTLLTLLTACGKPSSSASSVELYSELAAKASTYQAAYVPGTALDPEHCDSLLWTGLAGAAGWDVNLDSFEVEPGKYLRRPVDLPDCYVTGESKSQISRDMLLGVLWYSWDRKDAARLERLWDYARAHSFVLGEGPLSRTLLTPSLARLLVDTHHAVSGVWLPGSGWTQAVPQTEPRGLQGFERHLQWLRIALRAELTGELTSSDIALLDSHATSEPHNPIPPAILGRPFQDLLSTDVWPLDHPPTNANRCDYWVTQRNYGPDWLPCGMGDVQHSGADLNFVLRLASGRGSSE